MLVGRLALLLGRPGPEAIYGPGAQFSGQHGSKLTAGGHGRAVRAGPAVFRAAGIRRPAGGSRALGTESSAVLRFRVFPGFLFAEPF